MGFLGMRYFFYTIFMFSFQDSELNELRTTIEALKRQSGLNIPDPIISPNVGRRHTSPGMVAKVDIHSSPNHQNHHQNHHRPHPGGRGFHTLPMPAGKFNMSTVVILIYVVCTVV